MDFLPDVARIAQVVLGIGLVIFVHELGHFLAARLYRVDVDVFSIGMGPRIFGWRRGGTLYQLALIPIGGYVRMAGEERRFDGLPPRPGDITAKSVGARFVIYSGGVLMNVLFGLLVFPIVLFHGVSFPPPVLGDPIPGGPAWEKGLEGGTEVLEVNGQEVFDFMHIPTSVALGDPEVAELLVRSPAGPDGEGTERLVRLEPRYSDVLGMRTIDISPSLERGEDGLYVLEVREGSPAFAAGVRSGERLAAVEGGVPGLKPLDQLAVATARGGPLDLWIAGSGGRRLVHIEPTPSDQLSEPRVGITPPQNLVEGLRDDAHRRVALEEGDRVLSVAGLPIRRLGDLQLALLAALDAPRADGSAEALFVVEREDQRLELRAELASREDALALADDIALKTDLMTTEVLVNAGEPAAVAGIVDGDRVVRVSGVDVETWEDVRELIRAAAKRNQPVALWVSRASEGGKPQLLELEVSPAGIAIPLYGLDLREASYVYRADGLADAVRVGALCSWRFAQDAFLSLRRWMTADVSAKNFGGIISIGAISYSWAEAGWTKLVFFLCMLSINLAILNVLPIPLLDGGHLVFLIVEKIKGSPVSERVLAYSQMVGLVLILSLLVYITYNDLVRWVLPAG